jgi:glutaredoxin
VKQQSRDNRNALVAAVITVVAMILIAIFSQGQAPQPKRFAVVVSPEYFECEPCGKAIDYLESRGVEVLQVKLSRSETEDAKIKAFPTVFVGSRFVGLNEVKGGVR